MSLIICGGCGKEISNEYKFCPFCGAEIIAESLKEKTQVPDTNEFIICANCGDESPSSNKTCDTCGSVLTGAKIVKEPVVTGATVAAVKPRTGNKPDQKQVPASRAKKQKSKTQQQEVKSAGEISNKKMLIILGGILLITFVVLFVSGAFESHNPAPAQVVPQQATQPGVDLSMMQRINELESAVQANPNDLEKTLDLGHLLMDSRLFERAIIYYKKYLTAKPGVPDVMVDMGVCYFELQDYSSADAIMREAVKINPRHQIAHLNLGVVNMNWGKMDVAKDWLRKAVDINPSSEQGIKAKSLLESH